MSNGDQPPGKVERDPAAETGEQGVPASDPEQPDGEQASAAPDEPSGPTRPQPPAMTPLEVAANPAASVRVHCDARCGAERCLYASDTLPVDEDGEPYPDPREVLMSAAGCLDNPPACPGATDTTLPGRATGGNLDAGAAVLAVSSTPDLALAGRPSGAAVQTVRGSATLGARLAAADGAGGIDGATVTATSGAVAEPLTLTTAEVHGITSAGIDPSVAQVAAVPYAVGGEVLGMLRALGVATAGLEEVLVQRTPDPEPDPDGDSTEPAPDGDSTGTDPGETGDA